MHKECSDRKHAGMAFWLIRIVTVAIFIGKQWESMVVPTVGWIFLAIHDLIAKNGMMLVFR